MIIIFTIKNLKETIRQRSTLALFILFPIIFIAFFAFIFGGAGTTNQTYNIGIINRDTGFDQTLKEIFTNNTLLPHNQTEILTEGFGGYFISILGNLTYQNMPNFHIFTINEYKSEEEAQKPLEQRDIDILLIFNDNFTKGMVSAINNNHFFTYRNWITNVPKNINSTLINKGDPSYQNFQNTQKIIETQLQLLIQDFAGISTVGGQPRAGIVSIEDKEISVLEVTGFTFMIPGFLVFGLILTVGIIAGGLVRESENRTIERIRLARTSGWDLLLGATITQIIIATIQIILMVATATLFGFQSSGSLIDIAIILILTEFFVLGLGLLIAGFVKEANDANSLGSIISAPIGFISGSFLPLPHIDLLPNVIPVAGGGTRALEIWDLIPTTHAVNAIRSITLYGYSLSQVLFPVLVISLSGIIIFILSVMIYSKRQLGGFSLN
ncbi:MAG: ABC transporter permease [Candidatus Thorarchaeota archaeon]